MSVKRRQFNRRRARCEAGGKGTGGDNVAASVWLTEDSSVTFDGSVCRDFGNRDWRELGFEGGMWKHGTLGC